MNAMTDETLALSVTESTMQDWLTAMTLLRDAPAPVAARWTAIWPEDPQPTVRRPTAPCTRRRVAAAPTEPDDTESRVAGARTAYWVLLALALAAMLAF